jgi:TolA-binding protein
MKERPAYRWILAVKTLILGDRSSVVLGIVITLAITSGIALCDDVVMRDRVRSKQNVTVLDETYEKISIDTNGDGKEDETLPSDQVVSIRYSDTPATYTQGETYFRGNKFERAADLFQKALAEGKARKFWIEQHAGLYLGQCYFELGRQDPPHYDKVVAGLTAVITAKPNARTAPECRLLLAQCQTLKSDVAGAEAQYAELVKGAYGERWALRGKLALADLEARQKQSERALKLCDEARQAVAQPALADMKLDTDISIAQVYTATGKGKEAYDLLRQLAEEHGEHEVDVKARIFNAIGDSFMAQNRVKEAALAYLRVHLLYFKAQDEAPRAMYGAAVAFRTLKQADRAQELVHELIDRYPDTKWADMAKKEFPEAN